MWQWQVAQLLPQLSRGAGAGGGGKRLQLQNKQLKGQLENDPQNVRQC